MTNSNTPDKKNCTNQLATELLLKQQAFNEEEDHSSGFKIKFIVCIIFYLALSVFKYMFSQFEHVSPDFISSINACRNVISQIQVMLSVYLTLFAKKKGFIISIILNIICFLVTIPFLSTDDPIVSSDIAILLGTIFTISIINLMWKKIHTYIKELVSQRQELMALYEEVAASEDTLSEQNEQLTKYNQMMTDKEKELHHLAFFDNLTNLPNRRQIIDTLTQLLENPPTDSKKFAIVFADLNNFKKINDALGHHIGDSILRDIAQRWLPLVHPDDLLGRLGGDEFALIIRRPISSSEILTYVTTFAQSLEPVFKCENKDLHISGSFGIAQYPEDGDCADHLLKCADTAMYKAKTLAQNSIIFFNRSMQTEVMKKLEVENHLRNTKIYDELSLVYQPQFYAKNKKLRGFEVLVRWNSPKLGFMSPAVFIPTAEETGDIIPIGKWIFESSCLHFMQILDEFKTPPILSINISVVQLNDPGFMNMVEEVLQTTGFNPKLLEFEVTESLFIDSVEHATHILNKLHEKGIRIALDDFGTGYSSLSYLQHLPYDTLKIDKSFIDDIVTNKREGNTVSALVNLSHQLDLEVVAEGVETADQLEILKSMDCDFIQGYFWGKPWKFDEVLNFCHELHSAS